jgi:hypothetical protein
LPEPPQRAGSKQTDQPILEAVFGIRSGLMGLGNATKRRKTTREMWRMQSGVVKRDEVNEMAVRVPTLKFELIKTEGTPCTTWRTKVPGGWMVIVSFTPMISFKDASVAFYPDPEHKWDGNSLP